MRVFALVALSFATFGSAQDSSDVLARAREKLLRAIHSLPKYTSVENIDREYFAAPAPSRALCMTVDTTPSCNQIATLGESNPRLSRRIDFSGRWRWPMADGREIYAWPEFTSIQRMCSSTPTIPVISDGFLKQASAPVDVDLNLNQEQFEKATKDGITIAKNVPMGEDIQKLRVIVFDRIPYAVGSVTISKSEMK